MKIKGEIAGEWEKLLANSLEDDRKKGTIIPNSLFKILFSIYHSNDILECLSTATYIAGPLTGVDKQVSCPWPMVEGGIEISGRSRNLLFIDCDQIE